MFTLNIFILIFFLYFFSIIIYLHKNIRKFINISRRFQFDSSSEKKEILCIFAPLFRMSPRTTARWQLHRTAGWRPECRRLHPIRSLTLSSFLVCHRVTSVRVPVSSPRDRSSLFEEIELRFECRASISRNPCSGSCAREIVEATCAIETARG